VKNKTFASDRAVKSAALSVNNSVENNVKENYYPTINGSNRTCTYRRKTI